MFPAQISISLPGVRLRLEMSRERLEKHRQPPVKPPVVGRPLEGANLRHREYLVWSALIVEVARAIERGEDLACDEFSPLVKGWGGWLVMHRQFVQADCSGCGKTYEADECGTTDWSSVAGPRAGVGGRFLACPAGHTLFVHQTWIA